MSLVRVGLALAGSLAPAGLFWAGRCPACPPIPACPACPACPGAPAVGWTFLHLVTLLSLVVVAGVLGYLVGQRRDWIRADRGGLDDEVLAPSSRSLARLLEYKRS